MLGILEIEEKNRWIRKYNEYCRTQTIFFENYNVEHQFQTRIGRATLFLFYTKIFELYMKRNLDSSFSD